MFLGYNLRKYTKMRKNIDIKDLDLRKEMRDLLSNNKYFSYLLKAEFLQKSFIQSHHAQILMKILEI